MKRKVDNMKIKCKIVTLAALLMCSTTMLAEEKEVSSRWSGASHITVYALMHGGVSDGKVTSNNLGFHVTYDTGDGLDYSKINFVSAQMNQHGVKSDDANPITDQAKHSHINLIDIVGADPSFHFSSSKYWFYIECIENSSDGEIKYTHTNMSEDLTSIYMYSRGGTWTGWLTNTYPIPKYKVYRVPIEVLLDSNADDYCGIKVKNSTIALNYNSRNVQIYVDGDYKGQQDGTAIFSERTWDVSDLTVTPTTGYYIDASKGNGTGITLSGSKNGGTYNVYLVTKYTVTFNGNGNTSGSMSNQSFTYGTSQALTANTFKKEFTVTFDGNGGTSSNSSLKSSATFNGWEDRGSITYNGTSYDYTSFDAPYYANTYSDLKNAFGYNKYSLIQHYINNGMGEGRSAKGATPGLYPDGATVNNLSTTANGTVSLYANWSVPAITLPSASRTGYTFNGWYTSASGGTKAGGSGSSYTPSGNVTLYAQWTKGGYKAKFNANGGTVSPTGSDFTIDDALTLPVPTWIGHEFKGWKVTAADAGGSWTEGTVYTGTSIDSGQYGNVTFTAQWEAIPKGDLKIEVKGLVNDDMAVCKVVSETAGPEHVEYTVAISANDGSVTLKDIYAGSYTVTSGEWQWAYMVSGDNPQVVAVEGNKTVTVTITLAPKSGTPKHDEDNVVNVLGK